MPCHQQAPQTRIRRQGRIQCLAKTYVSESQPPHAFGRYRRRRRSGALTRFPAPAVAQAAPFRLGLLTVKTGPLAQGGIQMEQGVLTYLKETNYTMGGRKVDFVSADTGGNPAGTKTKAQELVERDKVDVILGPLAAFELYAINDYIQQNKRCRRSASRRPTI